MRTNPQRQRGVAVMRIIGWLVGLPLIGLICAALLGVMVVVLANDRLPPLDVMHDYRPRMPLQIYTVDKKLIAEFGAERRMFVPYEKTPVIVRQAVLAAEDARFFEHAGVDFKGILRAALANLRAGGTVQGASTITQQVAREFFLSNERTYTRKFAEALAALRIEQELSKEEILELYLNQIFLGKRAYGFESAARTYFDKSLGQLSIAEAAMLAGLPKAPSRYNPLTNPTRAATRQRYILGRMLENRFIDRAEYDAAIEEKLVYTSPKREFADLAPYVSELARSLVYDLYDETSYTAGLKVYTTIHSADQALANTAVQNGVIDYTLRTEYPGPEAQLQLDSDPKKAVTQIREAVANADKVQGTEAAIVINAKKKIVTVSRGDKLIKITGEGLEPVAAAFARKAPDNVRLKRGSLVRIVKRGKSWSLVRRPDVQAAFVATNTHDGSIRALVGGYDFARNRFNRVTQAWRQPGSSFKPFVFSAALSKGLTTSTVINDAPISLIDEDPELGPQLWEPKNFGGRFDGPVTMRTALLRSKNMVSVRIVRQIRAPYARDYVMRFGFERNKQPPVLTLGLGAGLVTPLQMVNGISVFANGGYRLAPYLISHITDTNGRIVARARPQYSGDENNRAIDARNAYIMDSMLRDVVRRGTAYEARKLGRVDLAGKTGTTNESHDAWFVGYQPSIAAAAWVGYDQPRDLGTRETGGKVALPIWMTYMRQALKEVPPTRQRPPRGVIQIEGDLYLTEATPESGIRSLGMREGGMTTGTTNRRTAEKLRNQVF